MDNTTHVSQPVTPEAFEAMEKEEHLNYELIDGVVLISPSPSREHQFISGNIFVELKERLKETPCQPIYTLNIQYANDIFKPDLMVFCDDEAELPEVIFEILSPSTKHRDLRLKLVKYEVMGVKEYWIVDPKAKTVTVHDYIHDSAEIYIIGETITSPNRPEIVIAVADIFTRKRGASHE